jgi:hypothetical protein
MNPTPNWIKNMAAPHELFRAPKSSASQLRTTVEDFTYWLNMMNPDLDFIVKKCPVGSVLFVIVFIFKNVFGVVVFFVEKGQNS